MKLKIGDIIKHEKFMDVAVVIASDPMPLKAGGICVKGLWMNQAFVNSYIMSKTVYLKIKEEDLTKWSKCLDPTAKCIRYETWEKIA